MYHLNTIMKKLTLFIILFQFNSTFGQSISDINRLKKQYEDIMNQQRGLNAAEDLDLDQIDSDLPENEQIYLSAPMIVAFQALSSSIIELKSIGSLR